MNYKQNVTILSNNCISVVFYKIYNTKYFSPTTNLHMDGKDFVKLCKNYKHYLKQNLKFPGIDNFKSYAYYPNYKLTKRPVAQLDDISIFFLHYNTEQEARTKWERRVNRVDLSRLMFIMAEDETTDDEVIRAFMKLNLPNKLCLTYKEHKIDGLLYRPDLRNDFNTG